MKVETLKAEVKDRASFEAGVGEPRGQRRSTARPPSGQSLFDSRNLLLETAGNIQTCLAPVAQL